ncbi:hypothetical protein QZH46_29575 [Pseudomonas corrugata]|nr:hypothetical protein [Pseudomonas corrugata]MDU9022530.1 hypothetical protein [Pseudomonas corrugata]SDU84238.1 hypothetical protein SAMN04490183_0395 [Pseudomonas corrugata]
MTSYKPTTAMPGPSWLVAKLRNASVQMGRCCQETGFKHVIQPSGLRG